MRVEILAGRVFEIGDAGGHRRVLHVDVNHGQKNGDALAFAAHEIRLGRRVNRVHLAVAGGDDEVRAGRHQRVGVAEKIKSEHGEQHPQRDQHRRTNSQQKRADDLARNATTSSTSTAAPAKPMSFNAASEAFPECFTPAW